MRILKIANIPPGSDTGMGRVMVESAAALRELGHEVNLMLGKDVPRRSRGRWDRFAFPVALVREVQRRAGLGERYDVVEVHEPSAAWYCFSRRRRRDLPPAVIMSHGSEENFWHHRLRLGAATGRPISLKSRLSVPLTLLSQVRYGLRHSQQVMCLNAQDEEFYRSVIDLPSSHLSRIQHGVDSAFFCDADYSSTGEPRLLFVGSWLDNKGRRVIPRVFAALHASLPFLRLSLCGVGVAREEVLREFPESTRSSLHVEPRVNSAELRTIYQAHDIMLLPSHFESWGLVLMEAAAAGMAVVAGRAGGPLEMFQHNVHALLVDATDAEAIESTVRALVERPDLRRRLGHAARERMRAFTWKAAAESQLRAYERALCVAYEEEKAP